MSQKNKDIGGDKNPNWRGGRRIDKDGYVLIYSPQHPFPEMHGYVREHRLVMEKQLNRFMTPGEVVHHLNGDVADNRIENLQLMTKAAHDALPGHFGNLSFEQRRAQNLGKKRSRRMGEIAIQLRPRWRRDKSVATGTSDLLLLSYEPSARLAS